MSDCRLLAFWTVVQEEGRINRTISAQIVRLLESINMRDTSPSRSTMKLAMFGRFRRNAEYQRNWTK
jgi:hypothetical protein